MSRARGLSEVCFMAITSVSVQRDFLLVLTFVAAVGSSVVAPLLAGDEFLVSAIPSRTAAR
jgi:hypothetical protein